MTTKILAEYQQRVTWPVRCGICHTAIPAGRNFTVRQDLHNGGFRWRIVCGCDR